ncbi:LOW QUALITY PROTEIN: uncharacterized protein LOC124271235 [Haliotis rubra]|uniref:LOW QUALITY PROTEIN: uncharacterized protein LOC124271235 n=1 Tax=Haliotis rubra TaxID=36100 RepID=UPI001EE58BE3|nr:LOW QUALITY PROTEIN: uncharacterized protein LOC124271235 [Haliotis rubra]
MHVFNDEMNICSSSDDGKKKPLPKFSSFVGAADIEERPSSTMDVVSLIGKRRPIKIHIGWMHKVGDKYRQVRRKYGGGTRELILDNLNIYPADIVQRAITLFFPGGASQVVSVDEVESFALGNFCGEELLRFNDDGGNECSLGQYLKAQGTYASRCYIYLLTKKKATRTVHAVARDAPSRRRRNPKSAFQSSEPGVRHPYESDLYHQPKECKQSQSSVCLTSGMIPNSHDTQTSRLLPTDKLGFILEDKSGLEIRYTFDPSSPFADLVPVDQNLHGKTVWDFSRFRFPNISDAHFEPTDHEFVVKRIQKKRHVFVNTELAVESGKTVFIFPMESPSSGFIVHHPSELWGYDRDQIVLGVIASCHGLSKPKYSWYRDEAVYKEGLNLCCITVNMPGVYYCRIEFGSCYDISHPLHIVEFSDCSFKRPKLEMAPTDVNANCCQDVADANNLPSRIIPSVNREHLDVDFTGNVCSGTYGTVYRGSWLATDVHVEIVSLTDMDGDDFVQCIREVNSRIRHPNILCLMACVENDKTLMLLSEYHEGATLEAVTFSAETRQYMCLDTFHKHIVAKQCCQALVYLHALSPPIMHRSIHPGSVWVLNEGATAKLSSPHVSQGTTRSNDEMALYLPPEVLVSQQDGDLAADIWGMGATLTEMFTESRLWGKLMQHPAPIDVVTKQLEFGQSPVSLQSLDMHREIITACLNMDPSLRPSAMQLLSYLKE